MFTEAAFDWFSGLALDNSKTYFTAHREVYDREIVKPLTDLLVELSKTFGGEPKLFRPYRDVRFSADKSPYKLMASGLLVERDEPGAYYVQISAEGFFAATGYYTMNHYQLEQYQISLSVDEDAIKNGAELDSILSRLTGAGYELHGEQTKRLPRGVPKDTPNPDLLKYKSLAISKSLTCDEAMQGKALEATTQLWNDAKPFLAWLQTHAGNP